MISFSAENDGALHAFERTFNQEIAVSERALEHRATSRNQQPGVVVEELLLWVDDTSIHHEVNAWLEAHTAASAADYNDIRHRALHRRLDDGMSPQTKAGVSGEKRKEPRDLKLLDEQHNRLTILRKYLKDSKKTERRQLSLRTTSQ
jgi:hypothetical protein